MMEYEIYNPVTRKYDIIWGYDFMDAFARNNLDPNDWEVTHEVFID